MATYKVQFVTGVLAPIVGVKPARLKMSVPMFLSRIVAAIGAAYKAAGTQLNPAQMGGVKLSVNQATQRVKLSIGAPDATLIALGFDGTPLVFKQETVGMGDEAYLAWALDDTMGNAQADHLGVLDPDYPEYSIANLTKECLGQIEGNCEVETDLCTGDVVVSDLANMTTSAGELTGYTTPDFRPGVTPTSEWGT